MKLGRRVANFNVFSLVRHKANVAEKKAIKAQTRCDVGVLENLVSWIIAKPKFGDAKPAFMKRLFLFSILYSILSGGICQYEIYDELSKPKMYRYSAETFDLLKEDGAYSLNDLAYFDLEDSNENQALENALRHFFPEVEIWQSGELNKKILSNEGPQYDYYLARVEYERHCVAIYTVGTSSGEGHAPTSYDTYIGFFFGGEELYRTSLSYFDNLSVEANFWRAIGLLRYSLDNESEFYSGKHSNWKGEAKGFDDNKRKAIQKGILYLPKESLDENLTNTLIEKLYPNAFEVLPQSEIEELILLGKDCWVMVDYMYQSEPIAKIYRPVEHYYQMVFNPKTGAVVFFSQEHKKKDQRVSEKTLRLLAKM